ncbi:hypothetical protein GCM10010406_21400 [Streptomyces thermolineatus]|uniref:Uncharacterized protein n=1 Tax=Streptomyces thermolineatus TaxID=44033 RepID=A0ABN3LL88_9ACTN
MRNRSSSNATTGTNVTSLDSDTDMDEALRRVTGKPAPARGDLIWPAPEPKPVTSPIGAAA